MSMTKIATVTLGAGGSATITFTSIPGTMTDLRLVFSTRDANNVNGYPVGDSSISFNGSTANRSARLLLGDGSGAGSGTYSDFPAWQPTAVATGNTFSNVEFYIPNYAGSTNKTVSISGVTENNGTMAYSYILAGLWSNTAAITSITLTAQGNFAQYSSATLYGITKGSLAGVTVS